MDAGQRVVVLGRIGAPHGVRGWVRLHSYTEPRAALLDYDEYLVGRENERRALRIDEGREQGKTLVAHFAGIDDRDAAAELRGADVAVAREAMPDPGYGHYYWADLEGLTVRHRGSRELGRVDYLLATGEHDVLVVSGEREILIPFVMDKVVKDVDLDNGIIDVDWEWD